MKPVTAADIGRIIVIQFLDHGENTHKPPLIEAVGRVVAVSANEVRLRAWGPVGEKMDNAVTDYSVVPSCIRRVRRLTRIPAR